MAKRERKYAHHTALRKQITACLARAVERHRLVRRRIGHAMPWADFTRLMDWQSDWENYLRQQRTKLYDGQRTNRGQEAAPTDPVTHAAQQPDAAV